MRMALTRALQPVSASHAGLLAILHACAFPPGERWGKDALALTLEMPGTFGLFSPGTGMVLARIAADQAEILTLAVVPKARRQGCGLALLRAAEARASLANANTMFLEVSVLNEAALLLYRRAGYQEVARRPHYYPDGSDALVLFSRLRLDAAAGG
jgi:[ribosomal protein S18]-alanine N-acetyltransferase